MRNYLKLLAVVCVFGAVAADAGERLKLKARLWTGAPSCVDYRHDDTVSRGLYLAMLDREEKIDDLNFFRTSDASATPTGGANTNRFRKVFRSSTRDGAVTQEDRSLSAAPIRLEDIRLAAYSDRGEMKMTGRIKCTPPAAPASQATPSRTDGCKVTIRVRGYSSTSVESLAPAPNGPLLFECSQTFWMSNGDDRVISLVCPAETHISAENYRELSHLQVEVETRRNR